MTHQDSEDEPRLAEAKAVAGREETERERKQREYRELMAEKHRKNNTRDDATRERGDGMPVGSPPPQLL